MDSSRSSLAFVTGTGWPLFFLLACSSDGTHEGEAGGSDYAGSGGSAISTGGQASGGALTAVGGTAGDLGSGGVESGSGGASEATGGDGSPASGGTGSGGEPQVGSGGAVTGGASPGDGDGDGVTDPEPDEIIGFGRNTTGGLAGNEVVVTTAEELIAAVGSPDPLIVTVQGTIVHQVSGGDDDSRIWVASNKTIRGADSSALVDANFSIREGNNIIFQDINLQNPEGKGTGDAVEFTESSSDIWIDHVTFLQSADGSLDFKRGSDNITVSWCKFAYTSATHDHNYANLIGHTDTWYEDRGKLRVTMHHNWYAENVIERMPRVRYGQVHVFNNYYSSTRTNYVIGVGVEAQILLQASYFENQGTETWFNWFEPNKCDAPCGDGKIEWTPDNVFDGTTVSTWADNSDVFDPPYPYQHVLQSAENARASVTERAGVRH